MVRTNEASSRLCIGISGAWQHVHNPYRAVQGTLTQLADGGTNHRCTANPKHIMQRMQAEAMIITAHGTTVHSTHFTAHLSSMAGSRSG